MENKSEPIATDAAHSPRGMNRREMVRRLATAVTAGTAMAAVPAAAVAHPSGHPRGAMMNGSAMEPAAQTPVTAHWTSLFFDPHQNETFTVLAERIIPGSTGAEVNRFVDLLLSVDSLEAQKRFLNSLSAFDAWSLEKYQRPFKDLTDEEQNQVLTEASTMKPSGGSSPFQRRHVLGPRSEASGSGATLTLRDHFEDLKHWVSEAYFSSEPGMKSMGWTGQVFFSSFPNCKQSEGKA